MVKFEKRTNLEVKRQKKLYEMKDKDKDFKKKELLEKYIAKMLYKWNDSKFEKKYLRKLERN